MRSTWKWIVAAFVAIAVLIPAGTYVYIHFIEGDAPAPLTLDSAGATAQTTPTTSPTTTTAAPASETTVAPTATTATTAAGAGGSAVAYKPTPASVLGYRVKETLFGQSNEAVGRTSDITGSMTIDGATVNTVDLTVNMK